MFHYQLVSADAWQDESARLAGLDYFSRPKRIKHFYDSDYRDVIKKLVADPESCKDFYQVLQQVGLPYQTYYHKIPDKVAQVLATALFTESAILLELPLPSWIYNNSTFNSAYVKKKFKKYPTINLMIAGLRLIWSTIDQSLSLFEMVRISISSFLQ
ncbi:hypothetical protein PT276_00005 [Orbaceae bacterium ESL0721]|nr:hypothetical protein [Orbaceae bacterium ESL0721]